MKLRKSGMTLCHVYPPTELMSSHTFAPQGSMNHFWESLAWLCVMCIHLLNWWAATLLLLKAVWSTLSPTPAAIVITRVYLLRCLKKSVLIFMKFGTISLLINFWEVEVKCFQIVIAQPWFKISLPNLAVQNIFVMNYNYWQNSRWPPGGGLHCEWFLVVL